MNRAEIISAIRAQLLLMYPSLDTEVTVTPYHILGIVSESIDKIEKKEPYFNQPKPPPTP